VHVLSFGRMAADGVRRIVLLLRIRPRADPIMGLLRVWNARTDEVLAFEPVEILVTLEHEPTVLFSRGHLQVLRDGPTYPIQTSRALVDDLIGYMAGAGREH
jgi:hypothetical protein